MSNADPTNDQDHGVAARDVATETDTDRNSRASHGSVGFVPFGTDDILHFQLVRDIEKLEASREALKHRIISALDSDGI
jgi:hypothetical protein